MAENLTLAVPFFNVTDMGRSLEFYVDGLGFEIERRWEPDGSIRWCMLRRGAVAIMLQTYQVPGHPEKPPLEHPGEGLSISFQCEDAVALYREFVERGVVTERPFVGNSMWVVLMQDPDGFRLEFESPTDAPEGTELPTE